MFKIFLSYFVVAISFLSLTCVPQVLFAAEVYFQVIPHTGSSTPTLVEVRIDPQSKKLNVVEGVLKFSGDALADSVIEVENGQSILPIWPTPPEYDNNKKSISFTGGIPNGFDSPGLLFKLRISASRSGDMSISYTDGNAYLNDGKGTKEAIDSEPLTVHVDKVLEPKTENTPFGFTRYVIILLSTLAVLVVIFKYGFKKNDE